MLVNFKNIKRKKQLNLLKIISKIRALLAIFTITSFCSYASNSDQWQMQTLQVKDGLPDSTVFSIQQDQSGFMWFGTTSGLARYDGHSFKLFKHDGADPNTISNNNAGNIFIDSKNVLWIGTFGGGVNSLNLNTGKLIRYPYSNTQLDSMVSVNVQTFYEDNNSNIWIGTATGLYQLNEGQLLNHYNHKQDDESSLAHSRVWDIVGDTYGNMWIATSEGLSYLDTKTGHFTNHQLPEEITVNISSNQFRKLFINDDFIWIGTSTGLYSFKLSTQTFQKHGIDLSIKINDIALLDENHLLIASIEGLYQYELGQNSFKKNADGHIWHLLSHLDIRDVFIDKSGLLWAATRDKGIIKIDQYSGFFQHHDTYYHDQQISENSKQVWSFDTDWHNSLYLGTADSLIRVINKNSFNDINLGNSKDTTGIIRDIKPALDKGLWVVGNKGLFYLANASSELKTVNEPFELAGIKPTDVFSIVETGTGEIWLTLYNIGILRWDPKHSKAELIQSHLGESLTDLNLGRVYQDSKNNIWITSNLKGLFRFNLKNNTFDLFRNDFNDANSLSSNRVRDVFEDSQGRIWVATARGLNLFNQETQSFQHFFKPQGLISNSIIALLEDSKQNLWIVYKFGISRFNLNQNEINNYFLNTAIRNDGINIRAAAIDKHDVLYFGSSNGYYTFNPYDLKNNSKYKPILKLTHVMINNQALSFEQLTTNGSQFTLDPDHKSISFEFSALDFKAPEQIRYSYRILELNKEWIDASSSKRIDLLNLNSGTYNIEIKANNNDGRWVEKRLKLQIIVMPEWWNIWWVRILFVVVGTALVLLTYYYRTYKIRKHNLELESEVKIRTSELLTLNKKLQAAAETDFLTGLYNRKGFLDHLYQQPKNAFKKCLVIADIDKFKNINDIYGHSAGDEILQKVAAVMSSLIKENDLLARWGGEEFIFYISNSDAATTHKLIERMRIEIENSNWTFLSKTLSVTCTFGICEYLDSMSLDECIKAADESMYLGKRKSRNTTVIYKIK